MTLVADKVIVKVSGGADVLDAALKGCIGGIDFAAEERLAH